MRTVGHHAVIIGASMAGLLTARVLTETYDRVTVVERDILPACGEHRRGVPQAQHLHGLLVSGLSALESRRWKRSRYAIACATAPAG